MNFVIKSRLICLLFALSLSACSETKSEGGANAPAAKAGNGPDAKPGFAITQGKLMLPTVAGNPGAAYFTLTNSSSKTATISAVAISGAGKAEVHQTTSTTMVKLDAQDIGHGTSLKFEPGRLHVMVFDIEPRLQPQTTTEITVVFSDGDKVSGSLAVEKAGSMGGMH
jgi:periplasmic copper chaperone A